MPLQALPFDCSYNGFAPLVNVYNLYIAMLFLVLQRVSYIIDCFTSPLQF